MSGQCCQLCNGTVVGPGEVDRRAEGGDCGAERVTACVVGPTGALLQERYTYSTCCPGQHGGQLLETRSS